MSNEIDIIDMWRIFVKRKSLVFVTFGLILFGGIFFLLGQQTFYKASATLEIGSLIKNDIIKDSNDKNSVSNKNSIVSVENLIYKLQIEYNGELTLSILPTTTDLIKISLTSLSKTDAKEKLSKIITTLKTSHQKILTDNLMLINEKILYLRNQKKHFENNKNSKEDVNKLLYIITRDINDLELVSSPPNIKNTEIIGNIIVDIVEPNTKKFLFLLIVGGMIFSFLVVFFLEFLLTYKEKKQL